MLSSYQFSMIKSKICYFCPFLPIFAYFFLSLRHIEIAPLNSWQYNSKSIFWLAIFGYNQIPGHLISLFPKFPSFLKQNLQQLKPAVKRQSAKWFWEQLECFWLNLGLKIYIRKNPVNVHKFLGLRGDSMPSTAGWV